MSLFSATLVLLNMIKGRLKDDTFNLIEFKSALQLFKLLQQQQKKRMLADTHSNLHAGHVMVLIGK